MDALAMQPRNDDTPAREYTIGELAALYGVSYRTLRFYEQRGFLCPTRKRTQRVFSGKDRVRLEVVILAKRLGFTLTEISELIQSWAPEPDTRHAPLSIMSLGLSKQQIRARIENLTRERESVQRAIEELRGVASRVEGAASGR